MGATINNESTTLERTAAKATCGLNAVYWYQTFAIDSVVVNLKSKKSLAQMEAS